MPKKPRKSTQIALGGLASALSLTLMFMTGLVPFGEYAFPAFAGLVLIAVDVEIGFKSALLVYTSVSLLSMLIVPVKESAMLFLFFFGYYPILLPRLNRIRPRIARRTIKFLIFNVSVIIAYFLLINLFGLTEILDSSGLFGQFSLLILWLAGNFLLIVYDNCSAKMYLAYLYWFRPKFLRKFK